MADQQRRCEQELAVGVWVFPDLTDRIFENCDATVDISARDRERVPRRNSRDQLAGDLGGELRPEHVDEQETRFKVSIQNEHHTAIGLLDLRLTAAIDQVPHR